MAKHFDADGISHGTADVLLLNVLVNGFHLLHIEFARQHHNIGKTAVELQRFDVRDVELGRQMHLLSHFVAIAHHGHIAGNDGRDACCLGGIDNGFHRRQVVIIDDGVHRQVALHAMLGTRGCDFVQVIDVKMVGRMRPHVELSNAKVNRVGTRLDGSSETFARAHGCHHFVIRDFSFHGCKITDFLCNFVGHEENSFLPHNGASVAQFLHTTGAAKGRKIAVCH